MKKRRVWAMLLCVAMIVAMIPASAFAETGGTITKTATIFADMPADWSTAALQNAVNNGLISGSSENGKNFIKPNNSLTRAEMGTILNNAFGAEQKAGLTGVTDVATSAWYYDQMAKAVQMGSFAADKQLRPEAFITRQETATVLAKVFKLPEAKTTALDSFTDKTSVAAWAKGYVASMAENGYMAGSNGKLNPTGNITRAEFAAIMNNMVAQYIKTAGTVSEVVAKGNVMINVSGVTLKNVTVNGNLILGDGIGSGDVTLDNVKVTGETVVRGGGVKSFIVKGNSNLGTIIIAKVDGNVRVSVEGNAKVELIEVADGKNDVIIEGTVAKLVVEGAVPVVAQKADIKTIEINAPKAELTVDKNSKVGTVAVGKEASSVTVAVSGTVTTVKTEGAKTEVKAEAGAKITKVEATKDASAPVISVAKDAKIETVTTAAPKTEVKGEGTVNKVEAKEGADNSKVTTPGTTVSADKNTEGVIAGSGSDAIEVKPGGSAESGGTKPSTGGGGGSSGPSSSVVAVFAAPLADGADPTVTQSALIKGYSASAVKWSNKDYVDVTIKGTDLKAHKNGQNADGYWVGFSVEAPSDAVKMQYAFATTRSALTSGSAVNIEQNIDGTGKDGIAFYTNLGDAQPKLWAQVQWLNTSGTAIGAATTYLMDVTGVKVEVTDGDSLTVALAAAQAGDVIVVKGTIGSTSAYETYIVDKAVTIKGSGSNSTIHGSFIVKADGVVFDGLTIENKYVDGNMSASKNAVNAYTDSLTVKNCKFISAATAVGYEPNGIVVFPKTVAGVYDISGNTFTGYKNATVDNMYHSAGVFVAEGYPMEQKAFLGGTGNSAALTNKPDAAIADGNTFSDCAYGYVRMGGFNWSAEAIGQTVQYATVYNQGAFFNGMKYSGEGAYIGLGTDIAITPTGGYYISDEFTGTLDGNNKTITVTNDTWKALIDRTVGECTIEDLTMKYTDFVYPLVNNNTGNLTFNNVKLEGETVRTDNNDSGYCCTNNTNASIVYNGCVNNANFNVGTKGYAAIFLGGMAHSMNLTFTDCVNNGTIQGQDVAMFIGNPHPYTASGNPAPEISKVKVTNCVNNGTLRGSNTANYFSTLGKSEVFAELNRACKESMTGPGKIVVGSATVGATIKDGVICIGETEDAAKYSVRLNAYSVATDKSTWVMSIQLDTNAAGPTTLKPGTFITKTEFAQINTGNAEMTPLTGVTVTGGVVVGTCEVEGTFYYVFEDIINGGETYNFGANGTKATVSVDAYSSDGTLLGTGGLK